MVTSASQIMIQKVGNGGSLEILTLVPPKLHILGQIRTLVPSQLSDHTGHTSQTAPRRKQDIDQLVLNHPELAPSLGFLPPLVEASEAIQKTTTANDQTISGRLAFGRALHPGHHREDPKTVPIVAFVGGVAGEFVRFIQLIPEVLSCDGGTPCQFRGESFQPRVQGLWLGNGSPVQQLHFAQSNGEPLEWLAIRHGGATSILRLVLREVEVPTRYSKAHAPILEADVEVRIELEHIVTLPAQGSVGALQTDICFNPWKPLEIAVLDQSSRWNIWKIESVNKHINAWTLEAGPSGHLTDEASDAAWDETDTEPKYDGWGALRFIDHGAALLVCNRRNSACLELRDQPTRFPRPKLALRKSADWILDIKQDSTSPNYIFITTSSRIFWVHIASESVEGAEWPQSNVKILLAWLHFGNVEDLSLSTEVMTLGSSILHSPPRTTTANSTTGIIVLLYSRLHKLKTLFTLDQGSRSPSFERDPYLLEIPGHDELEAPYHSTLVLKIVHRGGNDPDRQDRVDPSCQKDGTWLLRCMTLDGDLSLHEFFLAAPLSQANHALEGPRSLRRAINSRSSYRVREDFIVANGILDDDVQAWPLHTISSGIEDTAGLSDRQRRDILSPEDQWTIRLEWLTGLLRSPLAIPLDEALQLIRGRLSDSGGLLTAEVASLEELIDREVLVRDIDQDSAILRDFLRRMENRQTANDGDQPAMSLSISKLTLPSLMPTLDTSIDGSLSKTYDTVVDSWITSLAKPVPARIRSATERLIRHVATHSQLASHGLRRQLTVDQPERESQDLRDEEHLMSTLRVRQVPTVSQRKVSKHGSAHPPSSQLSEDEGFLPAAPLPTPEPTPSLHSQGSQTSLGETEDLPLQRVRALCKVGSLPPLPSASAGILSHWIVGQDPDTYDWEASKITQEPNDKPDAIEKARQKKRRKRTERGLKANHRIMEGSSSQPMPPRLAASQDDIPSYAQPSSQQTPITMSQPQPGRHGGGKGAKKPKKAGF
ncbi:MAG: hypothetical protein Q9166_003500 [cf. Caloplaca sp. 2 TL-2023]